MKLLFLCTANCCRSLLSEANFNVQASENMWAFSSGKKYGVSLDADFY